jgi:3-dehydroquinate dehydratase
MHHLLSENAKCRADIVAVVVNADREKDALRQFIAVLSKRIEDAVKRYQRASTGVLDE